MSNVERTDWRDRAYSLWHRRLGSDDLGFIDVDWIEYCHTCYRLLAVCELAVDNGDNDDKKCWITKKVATSLNAKGFLVLYQKAGDEIVRFRVRRLAPTEAFTFDTYTPDEWAAQVYALRWCHPLARTQAPPPVASRPVEPRRVLYPVGTPLTAPRPCPGCHTDHPAGTTCAGGLWPWEPTP